VPLALARHRVTQRQRINYTVPGQHRWSRAGLATLGGSLDTSQGLGCLNCCRRVSQRVRWFPPLSRSSSWRHTSGGLPSGACEKKSQWQQGAKCKGAEPLLTRGAVNAVVQTQGSQAVMARDRLLDAAHLVDHVIKGCEQVMRGRAISAVVGVVPARPFQPANGRCITTRSSSEGGAALAAV
jgi:hypothetical protein